MALIGAVVGDCDAIAVFLDLRLRQGERIRGVLNSILGREVPLKRADQVGTAQHSRASNPRQVVLQAEYPSGDLGKSFAPFFARLSPKNSE